MERNVVSITLYTSELIFDVQNKTYLTGRSRQDGQNYEAVANMQANDDDENLNQVMRSIQNAYATLQTKLSEYIVSGQTTGDNEQMDDSVNSLHFTLSMPTNYNRATIDTISGALHQYIVNSAISDWFVITNKADASDYAGLAASNLELVRESLNKRIRPSRTGISGTGRYNLLERVASPNISVDYGSVFFELSTITPGATIKFNLRRPNGTIITPTQVYSGAVDFGGTVIVRAWATKTGMMDSPAVEYRLNDN